MKAYLVAKACVGRNANGQARSDVYKLCHYDVIKRATDPYLALDIAPVLSQWSKGPKADMVFVGLKPEIKQQLTEDEYDDLVQYWVDQYIVLVLDHLKTRYNKLKGNQ